MTSNEVSGSSLPTSVSGHITSFSAVICMSDHISQLSSFVVVVMIVHNQFLPLALNQLGNRPPIQEGKQTSQEPASTCESLRSNQAQVTYVDFHVGSHARAYRKQYVLLSALHRILQ